jgi:hypothetical protein
VAAAIAGGLVPIAAQAAGKTARCEIRTNGDRYTGPCRFTPEAGGSFNVSPIGRSEFFSHAKDDPGITDISVTILGTEADVRGLTTFGINSRWGSAKRSRKDRACWIGDDFSICAR